MTTYQYGVPTNELAGLTKDAEPKSAAKRNTKKSTSDKNLYIKVIYV